MKVYITGRGNNIEGVYDSLKLVQENTCSGPFQKSNINERYWNCLCEESTPKSGCHNYYMEFELNAPNEQLKHRARLEELRPTSYQSSDEIKRILKKDAESKEFIVALSE